MKRPFVADIELADLARSIRLKEVELGIESVAIHIPGVVNITPDALSRYYVNNSFRDIHRHRTEAFVPCHLESGRSFHFGWYGRR